MKTESLEDGWKKVYPISPEISLHSWSLWFITMRETKPLRDYSLPVVWLGQTYLSTSAMRNRDMFSKSLFQPLLSKMWSAVWGADPDGDPEPLKMRSINTTQRPGTTCLVSALPSSTSDTTQSSHTSTQLQAFREICLERK